MLLGDMMMDGGREMVTVVAAEQDLTPVALVKNMLVVLVRGFWSL